MTRNDFKLAFIVAFVFNSWALAANPAPSGAAAAQPAPIGETSRAVPPISLPTAIALRQGVADGQTLSLFLDIRDDEGRAVSMIDKAHLQIEIGPYPTLVDSAARFSNATGADAALAAIFLVDISKSLPETGFARVREALNQWADSLGEQDRMAIVTFGEKVTTALDFTRQREKIQDAVATLKPTDKQTRLYDALLRGLDLGLRRDATLPRRRVIVLLSDGLDDTTDGAGFQQVYAHMEESPLPVYAIAFDPGGNASRKAEGHRTLGGLSRASGGELLEVDRNRFAEAYITVRRHVSEVFTVRARCESCPPDGRVYPVRLSLNEGGRIVTGNGHIRLMPSDAATSPGLAHSQPALAWLPAAIRPYWGALLGVVLAVITGVVLLLRLRRSPPEPEPEPTPILDAAPKTQAVGPAVIALDTPPRPIRQDDPGVRIRLSLIEGTRTGHSWGFMLQKQTALGRSPSNDVVLSDDPLISSRHCVLTREGDKIFVQDTESRNGTFVNGVEIKARYLLKDGDVLGLGNTTLRVTWSGL